MTPQTSDDETHVDPVGPGPAARIGRYTIGSHLGAGGMGQVLEVRDRELGRTVAAKVARGSNRARFVREARLTGQLEHPAIVPVYELGADPLAGDYYTMKRVDGSDLDQALTLARAGEGPTRSLVDWLGIFLKVCDAIAFAHSRGVLHRDLKPANIMVGAFGEVLVMDWGLAKLLGDHEPGGAPANEQASLSAADGFPATPPSVDAATLVAPPALEPVPGATPHTAAGAFLGTPGWAAPEQARSAATVDERADVYALGAILYQLLTLEPPFDQDNVPAIVVAQREGRYPRPSERAPDREIPYELEAVVARAMHTHADQRYPDVASLQADVRNFLDGRALSVVHYTAWQSLRRWARHHRTLVGATAAVLVVSLTAAVVSLVLYQKARASAKREAGARALADDRARAARRRLADFRAMSDVRRLDELEAELVSLGPQGWKMPRVQRWLRDARGLAARLQLHQQIVARIDALPRVSRPERWQRDVIAALIPRVQSLATRIAEVDAWQARVDEIRAATLDAHAERWARAIADIAAAPRYNGLRIAPQEGLVPLGADPQTGLWEFVHLPTGRIPRKRTGRFHIADDTGIVLVLLPGGRFRMGSVKGDHGPNTSPLSMDDEGPLHIVELAPFFIGKYELTQGQWQRMGGGQPSEFSPKKRYGSREQPPRLWTFSLANPVEHVSWTDCHRRLARHGFALPTEAQWDYAARGGRDAWWAVPTSALSKLGNFVDRSAFVTLRGIRDYADYDDGAPFHCRVGRFSPNGFGLHDVLGNLNELCRDPYVSTAYQHPTDREGNRLRLEGDGQRRVIRGMGWHNNVIDARVPKRSYVGHATKSYDLGVRVMRRVVRE